MSLILIRCIAAVADPELHQKWAIDLILIGLWLYIQFIPVDRHHIQNLGVHNRNKHREYFVAVTTGVFAHSDRPWTFD